MAPKSVSEVFPTRYLRSVAKDVVGWIKRPQRQVRRFVNKEAALSYDAARRTIVVADGLSWDERASLRRRLIQALRLVPPVHRVALDDILIGYYDQCLERYLYERLNRGMANRETCWFRLAQNDKCRGWVDPGSDREVALRAMVKREPKLAAIPFESFEVAPDGFVFSRSDNVYDEDDKALGVLRSFRRYGFRNVVSKTSPIILVFSTKTGRYRVASGRHRVAALRYLRAQGQLKGSVKVSCHRVEIPYESLVVTRPYDAGCRACDWGGVHDPGRGTHQDFYLREGVPVIRAKAGGKGGLQKWERMAPIFEGAVRGKRFLDVGAHRGLYCFKALECGAAHATALEPGQEFVDYLREAKTRFRLDSFDVVQGDFYDPKVFRRLGEEGFDCASFLGVIHHLLRLGIECGILTTFDELFERIAQIARESVIVEFSLPKEASLALPALKPHREEFSHERFESALRHVYPEVRKLGRARYKSGNKFGRFFYFARR